jgi:hypothetical protein
MMARRRKDRAKGAAQIKIELTDIARQIEELQKRKDELKRQREEAERNEIYEIVRGAGLDSESLQNILNTYLLSAGDVPPGENPGPTAEPDGGDGDTANQKKAEEKQDEA